MEKEKSDAQSCACVSPSASISGEVSLGRDSSVWHNTTLRGDIAPIEIGARTNIQDGAVLHVAVDLPCVLGDDVTIGHGAIVHGCKIGDRCLVGMGAIILNGAEIAEDCIVGAGALVTEGKKIGPRSLLLGSPAKVARTLSDDELRDILDNAASYVALSKKAAEEGSLRRLPSRSAR